MDADLSQIKRILNQVRSDKRCVVYQKSNMPLTVQEGHKVPDDLVWFYSECGGADIFFDEPFGYKILSPDKIVYANPLLIGEEYKTHFEKGVQKVLYFIADSSMGDVTISFSENPVFNGVCFDSSGGAHASEESIVIAKSFTEFLSLAYGAHGRGIIWNDRDPKYGTLGDV